MFLIDWDPENKKTKNRENIAVGYDNNTPQIVNSASATFTAEN